MFLEFQVMYTVSDFERNNYFRLIKPVNEHLGRCSQSHKQHTRSDHISQRQDSKVWWEEEETQVDHGSPVQPRVSFHQTITSHLT